MHISTLSYAAVVLVTVPFTDAHSFIYHAYGNAKCTGNAWALGYLPNTPVTTNYKYFETELPYQQCTAVFSNSAVPCKTGYARKSCEKRQYLNTGCGLSLATIETYVKAHPDSSKPWAKSVNKRKYWYFMDKYSSPAAFIDTKTEVQKILNKRALPRVTAGGTLRMHLHQINFDGAGPYRCRIDYTGMGTHWSKWIPVTKNVPGVKGYYKPGAGKNFPLTVRIPKGVKCTGTYGKAKNICMVRCENSAANGPFGGCVPVQLIAKAKVPLKPKPNPKGKPNPKPQPKPKPNPKGKPNPPTKPNPKPKVPVRPPKVVHTTKVVLQTKVVYVTNQKNVVVTNTQVVTDTQVQTITLTDTTEETDTVMVTDQPVATSGSPNGPVDTDQPGPSSGAIATDQAFSGTVTEPIETTAPPPTGTSEVPGPVVSTDPANPIDYADSSTDEEDQNEPPTFPTSNNDPSLDTAPMDPADADDVDGDANNPGEPTADDDY
ncbi:hypothetical protein TWF694_008358 [Orbilia ellipsospora]|uniref:Uncharacterized protein n=1 Tax=Orbilia ellipsospora TaxID=2528407 RepID=A0AAV9XFW9_9PEZI